MVDFIYFCIVLHFIFTGKCYGLLFYWCALSLQAPWFPFRWRKGRYRVAAAARATRGNLRLLCAGTSCSSGPGSAGSGSRPGTRCAGTAERPRFLPLSLCVFFLSFVFNLSLWSSVISP